MERLLNIPGEQEMIGRGISFCAVCDAAFYRNKHVIIVGAGYFMLRVAMEILLSESSIVTTFYFK